ncbi:AAA family ATPase [Methanobrevibacter sp.]|uniref:AAA family ATPase n=1 Tax=Methanobrevibacter sp. TaxID=66852 RepID=UPI0038682C24
MVSEIKLKNIEIKSFRGIKNSSIDFNNKSLVLVGENGSGKSSIVNAFEYLFTGKVDTLSGKQAINHTQSILHIGDEKEELLVEAKINQSTITRSIDEFNYSEELNDLIDDFKNASFLLNRKKLLNFIETTPAKRYESITTLIGFDDLDKIESTLNKTNKRFRNKVKNKTEEIEKKVNTITMLLECETDDIYTRINEILKKHDIETISEDTNLKRFLNNIPINDFEKTNDLFDLIDLLDIDINSLNIEFEELLSSYEQAALYELKSTSTLLDILNKSSEYLEKEKPQTCPVCRRNIESAQILNYIKNKKQELNRNETSLINWKNDYAEFKGKLIKLNNDMKIISAKSQYAFENDLDDLTNNLDKLADFEITLSQIDSNALINLEEEFNELKGKIVNDFDSLNDENARELGNIYEVLINLSQKQELEDELKLLENQFNTSNITYELFKNKKQNAVRNIIDDIEQLVNDYYNFIHADEEFNSPAIGVPKSTGITLNLKFNTISADPRAFSSEGHLDSLGLCIFLAFVKRFNKYNFIILDDIISTVDINHKEKVAMLLLSEFKDYQFIITTHSNLWFRQLKNYVHNYGLNPNFTFAEIRTLDENTGPVLTRNLSPNELIDKYIELGDTFAAGNAIRRQLENIFEKVCEINQIPLPIKKHYMVDDYFRAIKPFFLESKLFNSAPKCKEYYQEVFDTLDSSRYMGNLLSHDDDANLDVSINEVIKFRDAVSQFEKSMQCWEGHNAFLRFNEEYKYAICTHPNCLKKISFKNKN